MAPLDLTRLDRVDWNFPGAGTLKGSVQSIHWFPGNFIAHIPAALIQVLSRPGEVVFDPFSGSATTSVEALRLRRRTIASDRLSASHLIASAKFALLVEETNGGLLMRLRDKLIFEQQCRSSTPDALGRGGHPELAKWYSADTLSQLRFLWNEIDHFPQTERKILTAIFSDTLFQCASTAGSITRTGKKRRHHWGWVADNVRPKQPVEHNAIRIFRERIENLPIGERTHRLSKQDCHILQQDARHLALAENTIDLIVTSPPYIGMIDYTHANRLLYLWMNWSLVNERVDEIGARYRRARKGLHTEYKADMALCRNEMERVLRGGGYCALVLGESQKYPGTANGIFALFSEKMDMVWGPFSRSPTRRRVSDRRAIEPIEHIAIFQKK